MRKGKFKFTNKNGVEEQVALETLLDQIVDSPIRALMPNTEYQRGEIVFYKPIPLFFAVCVGEGITDENIKALMNASNYGVPTQCGTATFIVHVTSYIPTRKDLTAYAKLESPHLTGIPTAPTASSNNNTTQIATTEFVKTALATFNLVEYLKIADAQRTYAPLNSPRLTGTPVAPTPSSFSEDASIATTEWVTRVLYIRGGGIVAANLNQNGYVKFANGLILQWGVYTIGTRNVTITLPIATSVTYAVIAVARTENNYGCSGSQSCQYVSNVTNKTFQAGSYDRGNGYAGFWWMSIGKA